MLVVAAVAAVPWTLVACSHENDARDEAARVAACPDVSRSEAFAVGRAPDVDVVAAIDEMMCDGEISEEEDRCLRSPWSRIAQAAERDEFADSPIGAVRAVAGQETTITGVVERSSRTARIAVELDGAEGVYDVERTRLGWVAVAGEGCASGAAIEPFDEDEMSEECREAMEEATPDADGTVVFGCVDEVTDGPLMEEFLNDDLPMDDLLMDDLPPGE